MRGIWETQTGNTWPAWAAFRSAGVNRIYFLACDEQKGWIFNARQLSSDYYKAVVETQKFQYAITRDLHWPEKDKGAIQHPYQMIDRVKSDIAAIGGQHVPYMIDGEFPYRDQDFLIEIFAGIRKAFPDLLLSWTMEGLQGGWIKASKRLVAWINADANMVVVPQTFYSHMEPIPLDRIRLDMEQTGIKPSRIRLCYDAARQRPLRWDGFLFHSGRLVQI